MRNGGTGFILALALVACGGGGDAALDARPGADAVVRLDATSPDAQSQSRIDTILGLLTDGATTSAALDAALLSASRAESWPLHEGTRWLFARAWTNPPTDVALTGDWVDFAAGALPASVAAIGNYVYVLLDESDGDLPPAGLYKWWSQSGGYQAPPEATCFGYDNFGEYGLVAPPSTPHLQRFPGFTDGTLAPRTVRLRVPAAGLAHRVVLFADGQNLFDPNANFGGWQASNALAAANYADVLAVAVDNTADRFDEYTPVADTVDSTSVGGNANAYLAMLDDDVLPFVRSRFGVTADTNSLAVMGSSLGGLVSLYSGMTTPTRARCVVGLSPTLGWGSFAADNDATLIEQWAAHAPASVVLSAGGGVTGACVDSDGDGVNDDSNDSDNYCVTMQLATVLRSLGYQDNVDLAVIHNAGAGHNEAAWAAVLPDALASCQAFGWTN